MSEKTFLNVAVTDADRQIFRDGGRTLEELLCAMAKYGELLIVNYKDGWRCAIEAFGMPKGVCYKISSDFGCETVSRAGQQCALRLDAALSAVGE